MAVSGYLEDAEYSAVELDIYVDWLLRYAMQAAGCTDFLRLERVI